jgi:2-methylaconitate cis-trans-isomerase PrpF
MFPTGNVVDRLAVPGLGEVEATLITAGNPTVFVDASVLGLGGAELQPRVDTDAELLRRGEAIRAHAAVAMGLATSAEEASRTRLHTPKIAWVSPPQGYAASSGRAVAEGDTDLTIRMLSMGKMHHAITGTGAIATAVASAIEGTVVHGARRRAADPLRTRLGHPSGTLAVGAEVAREGGEWKVARAVMSRSARRLMEGWVRVPANR